MGSPGSLFCGMLSERMSTRLYIYKLTQNAEHMQTVAYVAHVSYRGDCRCGDSRKWDCSQCCCELKKNKQSAIISFYLLTKCNRYTTAYREGRFVWLHSLAPLGWNCGAVCAKMTVYLLMVAEKQSGKHLSTQSSKQQASELAPWIKAFGAKPRRPKISLWHLHNGSKTLTFTYCLSSALPLSTVAFALILILFFFFKCNHFIFVYKGSPNQQYYSPGLFWTVFSLGI